MTETETPETIRSALAYFQRGGLVEMTERTLAEIAAGRTAVECDADGVLALCHLAAEALAARARLAVPGDEMAELLATLSAFGSAGTHSNLFQRAFDALTALRARVAGLEGALTDIRDFPRPGYPRRDEDGYPMEIEYDEFAYRRMVDGYRHVARAALSPSAQEAPDAE
ncbi:hypothetical protein CNY89_02375 [Amaricoccus sp. HAR-UPW-R2A-40]|nr:hypothetical protein CNY89_02375 [Amaricoccus sp. HAR-UPW-R2A-40]